MDGLLTYMELRSYSVEQCDRQGVPKNTRSVVSKPIQLFILAIWDVLLNTSGYAASVLCNSRDFIYLTKWPPFDLNLVFNVTYYAESQS